MPRRWCRTVFGGVKALIDPRPRPSRFARRRRAPSKSAAAISSGLRRLSCAGSRRLARRALDAPDAQRIHQSRACLDRLQNGVEALVDLYLLAECDYLVGDSTSAFAKVAGLLSAAPASRRYDAKPPRVFNVRHGEMVEGAAREAVMALRARSGAAGDTERRTQCRANSVRKWVRSVTNPLAVRWRR